MVTVVLLSASCASKVYFTHDARVVIDSAGKDPTKFQYYNDKEILLRHKLPNQDIKPVDGVVVIDEGLSVTDLRIRRGTPCRVDSIEGNSYWMRFEIAEGKTLRFYKNQYDHYQIWADKWSQGRGNIQYGNKPFVIERVGNDCLLMVKNAQTFKETKKRKIAEGVKVGQEMRELVPDSVAKDSIRW